MTVEKRRSFIINFIYISLIAAIAFVVVKYAMPLLSPFVIGFIFAYILQRPIRFFRRITRVGEKTIALMVVIAFYVLLALFLMLVGLGIASWAQGFVNLMPQLYENHFKPVITDIFAGIEGYAFLMDKSVFEIVRVWESQIVSSLGNMVSNISVGLMSAISGIASFLPGFFIKFVLAIISSFFIAMDYNRLTGFVAAQLSDKSRMVFLQIKEYLIGTLFDCVRSYLMIMSITFVELLAGLKIIGLKHAVMIAFIISVFDILPVLGTGGIMIPWAVIAVLSGRYSFAVKLLVIYLAITVIRNIIEPKIVGSQLGLHPVVTLASMFAGVQLLGAVGLFGFPICLSLLRYLNSTGTISIFKDSKI